jgi:hypothetical protein
MVFHYPAFFTVHCDARNLAKATLPDMFHMPRRLCLYIKGHRIPLFQSVVDCTRGRRDERCGSSVDSRPRWRPLDLLRVFILPGVYVFFPGGMCCLFHLA